MNIENQEDSQKYYEQFIEELNKNIQEKKVFDKNEFIENIKIVEEYSLDKKKIFGLFSNPKFFLEYLSQNTTEAIGYTPEEIYKKGLIFAFSTAHWKQLPTAVKVFKWGNRFREVLDNKVPIVHQEAYFCGLKLKNKWGDFRTYFIKQKFLTATNNGYNPGLSFLEGEDITSIFKGDYFWSRMTATYQDRFYCRAFFPYGKKREYNDLLSTRELEILKLAIEQKSNTEISELLGISKNTVERHRKNMIARVGVIDMTALIRICNLCGVI